MSTTQTLSSTGTFVATRRWLPLTIMLSGTFMVTLDFFIVNVAIPSMQRDLAASAAAIEWIAAGYGLAYAALLISGGRLGDLYGRRRIFAVGMFAFTFASVSCGFAPNAAWLIAARVGQGIGAELLAPQVLAVIGTLYAGAERARGFAALGMVLGIASACGQVLGGLLIQADLFGLGWRLCFLVNLPLGVAALLLLPRAVPESRGAAGSRLDAGGAALVTCGLVALLLPLIEGRGQGWPAWSWISLGLSLVLLAMLAAQQRRRTARGYAPLLHRSVWQSAGFRTGLLAVLALCGGVASCFFVLALYLQNGRGLSPFQSGSLFTILALAFTATSLSAHRITGWLRRPPLSFGALTMAAGLAATCLAVHQIGDTGSPLLLLPPLMLEGAGMGLVMAPLVSTVLAGLPQHHAGAAAGVLATAQQFGNALGVALIGLVFFGSLGERGSYPAAFGASLACLAILAVVLAALTARLSGQGGDR